VAHNSKTDISTAPLILAAWLSLENLVNIRISSSL